MNADNQFSFKIPAVAEALSIAIARVSIILKKLKIVHTVQDDISICMSEVLSNILEHSGVGKDDTIEITINYKKNTIKIFIIDTGYIPPDDSVVTIDSFPASNLAKKGRGKSMMYLLSDEITYQRVNKKNITTIIKKLT